MSGRFATPRRQTWADRILSGSGSVYGTILTSSLLVSLSSGERGNAWVMIAALAIAESVFALAHAWSALLIEGHARARLPGPAELGHALGHEWPLVKASLPAIAILLLAAIGLIGVDTAVNLALAVNTAVLFAGGLALAWVAGLRGLKALAVGLVACVLGLVLIILKIWVHH
ncbi:hypothetical protein OM076_16085 [Solirubrobacter ginsenosidimutans]|uniref:Uncharacterized protein n=1 Tax=Solirubrobacter ginsenosidimutans TaxID=490573 RepID=A0A9X3MV10_9ACTN|nr:hypothetical protein [Solirubrobacter ginsenosidimutans]MDA0161793.1 hypothetical protein [Solirubrobacter ginsenosidimutans]